MSKFPVQVGLYTVVRISQKKMLLWENSVRYADIYVYFFVIFYARSELAKEERIERGEEDDLCTGVKGCRQMTDERKRKSE
jgi:hypothetical protein